VQGRAQTKVCIYTWQIQFIPTHNYWRSEDVNTPNVNGLLSLYVYVHVIIVDTLSTFA